ncbi:glutamine amidotransferase family protein [Thermotoga sp.]|uniref:class II glutamine amidotransferase n=1 Tax=Thermotoga sp. TaxID=28240 RepID=UPI0025CBD8D0|nr:glutamine amidotransferase family protein [Thermotoga sp.]
MNALSYNLPRLIPDKDFKVPSACGISGIMNTSGKRFIGSVIVETMALMRERGNGLGAGYAAYGIYPELKDFYCFHMLYNSELDKRNAEEYIKSHYEIIESEPIPTRRNPHIKEVHILWRYFLKPKSIPEGMTEEDFIVDTVMFINEKVDGSFVMSSGKNMGVFKGVGFPEDIADFYRIDEYKGYIWTAHNRFPTNTVGWWGGAHPFGILDWTVVHNGEISSYGINRRFLEAYGYKCTLMTDTEVVAYLVDLFMRRFGYSPQLTAKILAAPLWKDIDLMPEEERKLYTALRMNYGGALLNGPFAIIVANNNMMMGLNDRIKLRPLVAATKDDFLYIASEESAIRVVCPDPDEVWAPKAGDPVVGVLKSTEKVRVALEGENG